MAAATGASSTDRSGETAKAAAQVNCLVIEQTRNSVRSVNGRRRAMSANPQAWRAITRPFRTTATAPPGPG